MSFIDKATLFNQNGYVVEKNLLSKIEVDYLREESVALVKLFSEKHDVDVTLECARNKITGAEETQLLQCEDIHFYSASYCRLMVDERMVSLATKVMGTNNIKLHGTKVFIKPKNNGSPVPLHQDYVDFPYKNHSLISAIIFLEDVIDSSSKVCLIPCSHKQGPLEHSPDGGWHLPFDEYSLDSATPIHVQAGDVMLIDCLTVHGSGFNRSSQAQTFILLQLCNPDDEPDDERPYPRGYGMMIQGINTNI